MYDKIANLYFNNTMDIYEYIKMTLETITAEIIQQCKLQDLSHKVFFIWKFKKACMECSKQEKLTMIKQP